MDAKKALEISGGIYEMALAGKEEEIHCYLWNI
jgi:hypothetical protein